MVNQSAQDSVVLIYFFLEFGDTLISKFKRFLLKGEYLMEE